MTTSSHTVTNVHQLDPQAKGNRRLAVILEHIREDCIDLETRETEARGYIVARLNNLIAELRRDSTPTPPSAPELEPFAEGPDTRFR